MVISRNVTITNAAQNYDLLTLLKAVLGATELLPDCCAELSITADSANAGPVLKGDSTITDTIYGFKLLPGNGFDWGSGNTQNDIVLSKILLRTPTAGAAGQILHVDARVI